MKNYHVVAKRILAMGILLGRPKASAVLTTVIKRNISVFSW